MSEAQLIAELREIAKGVEGLRVRAKEEPVVAYYTGSRDILLRLANLYEMRCPLAVAFFNSPVVVKEV